MNSRSGCELKYLVREALWHFEQGRYDDALESLKNANIVAHRMFGKKEDKKCSKEK